MRQYLIYLLLSCIILTACQNSKKLINSGRYDEAIDLATRKLIRDKKNDSQILALEEAFTKAAGKDFARINFLKQEGQPNNRGEIYLTYLHINNRQNRIKPLLPLHIKSQNREAKFNFTDISSELINAKEKTAEYEYTLAMQLLSKESKSDARNAYEKFKYVKSLYPTYKDVDDQINTAYALGISHVLFKMQNQSGIPLPANFENELTKISLQDLNRTWLQYDVNTVEGRKYDYVIWANLKVIDVTPESINANSYIESKEVNDGFRYVLDEKGNVKKDQAGNDIKVAKTKVISCEVQEKHQLKKAIITGVLDYVNNSTQQLIKSNPVVAETIFENHFAQAIGDLSALKPASSKKLNTSFVPFPPSPAMILDAGQQLKAKIKDIIWANKNLLF